MKKLKIVSLGLALVVTISSCIYVVAKTEDELRQEYNQSQQTIKDNKQKIENLKKEEKTINEQMAELDKQSDVLQGEITVIETKIKELDVEIEMQEKIIEEKEVEKEQKMEDAASILRIMYERGDVNEYAVLLDSLSTGDFFEFLSNNEIQAQIGDFNNKVINEMIGVIDSLNEAKTIVEQSKIEQENAKEKLEIQKSVYDNQIKLKGEYLQTLESQKDTYEKLVKEEQESAKAILKQINSLSSNSTSTTYIGGEFVWPTASSGYYISSPFGYRIHPIFGTKKFHSGIDIAIASGQPIYAAASGTVIRSADLNDGFGKCVIVDHGGGVQTLYAHCSSLLVNVGQTVVAGEKIALIGSTGNSTGPHLHFSVIKNGSYVDPDTYLKG